MGIRLKGQTSGYVEIKAPATAADNTLTLPNGNGSSNQVLTTDGSGGLTFAAPQLSTDTTPQLGGDLDVNGNDIVTTSNGDIDLDPNGSGQVVFKGNSTRGSGQIKLNCEQNSHGITVKGPPHSSGANYTLTLPNDTGTSGQLLSTNGSGVTSWASVGGSTYEATASGAIANGDPCIVNSSGNIEAVKKNTSALTNASVGTETQLVRGATGTSNKFMFMDSIYVESLNKIVIVYSESGAGIYARVGSFDSDGNLTVTSEQQIHSSSSAEEPAVTYHPTQEKFLCIWNNGDGLNARSFILTGTTISFDTTASQIHTSSSGVRDIGAAYDSNADRTLVAYGLRTGSEIGQAVVIQVNSNGTLSSGTVETVESDACSALQGTVYDPDAQKLAIFYNNNGTTKGRVATIDTSDNSVDLGASATIVSAGSSHFAAAHDPVNDKILAAYQNSSDNKGYLVVATISGTSISFGTPVAYEAGQANDNDISYDPTGDKFLVVNGDGGNGDRGAAVSATISGTTPSVTTASQLDATGGQTYHSTVFANDFDKHYVVYAKESNRDLELNVVTTTTTNPNLTTENFIGISDAAYADTATATVQIVGSVDDAQSGLTPGKKHYVKKDGSLTTTTTQLPLVEAGTAVAATKIIVKG